MSRRRSRSHKNNSHRNSKKPQRNFYISFDPVELVPSVIRRPFQIYRKARSNYEKVERGIRRINATVRRRARAQKYLGANKRPVETKNVSRQRQIKGIRVRTPQPFGRETVRHFYRDTVCRRRSDRRDSLFATGRAGKGKGGPKTRVLTVDSEVKCR